MASSDSDATFEVDKILKQRKRKGFIEYLVKWKGSDHDEESWEPAKNLNNCASAVAEFLKITTPAKSPKKSSRSQSRSRSRSRTRTTKTKSSKTRRSRSRTSRSRSRSASRTRVTKKIESPSRQSRRTEVVTHKSISREPGRVEKTTEIIRESRDDSKPNELKKIHVVHTRKEVKTVEDKVDGKVATTKPHVAIGNGLYTLWQSADTAVLVVFVCMTIICVSFLVENYLSPKDVWAFFVGIYASLCGFVSGCCQMVSGAFGTMWQSTANFTRQIWRKVTTN